MVSEEFGAIIRACMLVIVAVGLLGCVSQTANLNRPADGVVLRETIAVAEGGATYSHTEGYITAGTTGVQHWYELTGPAGAALITLINGSDAAAILWDSDFVDALLEAGFQVLRYDPRDCGRSERLPWPKGFNGLSWTPQSPPPYPLTALMHDLVGILDELGIQQTHLIGVSMGGMIAQLMALNVPNRVLSLSLLSTSPSSSFDPAVDALGDDHLKDVAAMMKRAGMDNAFSFFLGDRWMASLAEALQYVTGSSDNGADIKRFIREMEEFGGYNFMSGQGFAIAAAPSRVQQLPNIVAPTLVLHGSADPWFRLSHAELLAHLIPGARLVVIKGEGHGFPRTMYNQYAQQIVAHIRQAELSMLHQE